MSVSNEEKIQSDLQKYCESILSHENINPCQAFTLDKFPTIIKKYIESMCQTTDAHPILISMSLLATLSALTKTKCRFEGLHKDIYPNLWLAAFTNSGRFKTTALELGNTLARKQERIVYQSLKPINRALDVTEDGKERLQLMQKKHDFEKLSVMLADRITPEALINCLSRGCGGAIYLSEMGGWLNSMDKKHNKDFKPLITDLYDCKEYSSNETLKRGKEQINRPFLSICGYSTFEWVKEYLTEEDILSGFLARFLLFTPITKNENIRPSVFPKSITIDDEAGNKIFNNIQNCEPDRVYRFSEESKKTYEELFNLIYDIFICYSSDSQRILEPFVKRWTVYLVKLAMLFEMQINPFSCELSPESLQSAFHLIHCSMKSTITLFEVHFSGKYKKVTEKLKLYLAKKNGYVSRRTMIRSGVIDGNIKIYDDYLNILIESGEIVKVLEPETGYQLINLKD